MELIKIEENNKNNIPLYKDLEKNKLIVVSENISEIIIDVCAGLVGLVVLIPLTTIIFILSKILKDNGPIFFKQDRIGKDGKLFKMLKYRTMVVGADDILEKYLAENKEAKEEYTKYKKFKK